MSSQISFSPRLRHSPYFDATIADGAVSFTAYNHMLMPTGYGDPAAEYARLIDGVAMWDVAVERQVEVRGADAARLVQALTPRRLDRLRPGVGRYAAVCDHRGVLINDPILLKHADDRYWFSIADGDLLLWARAVAAERGFDVEVFEPDVSPLAIQGPCAGDVVAALFGESSRALGHFHFRPVELDGIPIVLARSGWSKQGGFELYLQDGARGDELWQRVKRAGRPFAIGPGSPNAAERVESGLLSWGTDTDDHTSPFEVGLERYVDLDVPDDVIGIAALRETRASGARRRRLGVLFDRDDRAAAIDQRWPLSRGDGAAGELSAYVWSPRLQRTIGLCLVTADAAPGDAVAVARPNGERLTGVLTELPFLPPGR